MTVGDIVSVLEAAVPLTAQAGYDNSGLLVGDRHAEIGSALLCVDVTEQVMDRAEQLGAGLVVSHHPILFHPLARLTGSTYVERVVERAVRAGIALYACHTNLDSVPGGISHRLGELFGLRETSLLEPTRADDPAVGFGIVGELPEPVPVKEFLLRVKTTLGLEVLRHSPIFRPNVQRVAVCSGSGGSLLEQARAAGAGVYVAADFKYNHFLDADRDLVIADAGHFESEYCAIDLIDAIIRKKFATFALHRIGRETNPVQYIV